MKQKMVEKMDIPEGVTCTYIDGTLTCKSSETEISKKIFSPSISVKTEGNEIILSSGRENKNDYKKIKTFIAHIRNLFRGLTEKYTYKLESASVHFPMTLKVEGNKLAIGNFLGEKNPRSAEILPNVEVNVSGQQITVTSNNRDAAGQTAANFEKATKIKGRDRRIYQDGIFITEKPSRNAIQRKSKEAK